MNRGYSHDTIAIKEFIGDHNKQHQLMSSHIVNLPLVVICSQGFGKIFRFSINFYSLFNYSRFITINQTRDFLISI